MQYTNGLTQPIVPIGSLPGIGSWYRKCRKDMDLGLGIHLYMCHQNYCTICDSVSIVEAAIGQC